MRNGYQKPGFGLPPQYVGVVLQAANDLLCTLQQVAGRVAAVLGSAQFEMIKPTRLLFRELVERGPVQLANLRFRFRPGETRTSGFAANRG